MDKIFTLDMIPPTPAEEFAMFLEDGGWMIALAALFIVGAVIGIFIFAKNNKENKK